MSDLFVQFQPALVIFDKDGTLIDFNYMWAGWAEKLAAQLDAATDKPVGGALMQAFGYDAAQQRVLAGSPLAVHSMQGLYELAVGVLVQNGIEPGAAERIVRNLWDVPDPITLAKPLADLPRLFTALHDRGVQTAIVTSDDRGPTLATLSALDISRLTNVLVCADDGMPNKPAPDMILHVCRSLNVSPLRTLMVGDGVSDMLAGRSAGVLACVGVLSGLSDWETLAPYADLVLDSVADLLPPAGRAP